MKIYYFSSILLLTLFYMVNGQNVSGVKTIPNINASTPIPQKTILPPNYSPPRYITTTTTTTTTKKICPTIIRSSIERLCEERGGGKLIEDDCGFNSICLLPCGAGAASTTTTIVNATNSKTLPKSLPNTIIKDYYLSHSIYDNYVFCSCIYADKISNEYGPGKYTSSVGICQEKLKARLPNDPIPVTTTTTKTISTTTSTKTTTCPTKVLDNVRELCEKNSGKLITQGCGISVCLLSCGVSVLQKRASEPKTLDEVRTKVLPSTTTSTKYIPDDARNGFSSYLENYRKQQITSSSSTTTTSTKYIPDDARNGFSSYLENYKKQQITSSSSTTTTSTKYIPDDARNGFSSYLENYRKQQITRTTTKTLPTTKILPSSHVIKDYYLKHGEFHGIVYCSCIYVDSYSSGYNEGTLSDDIGECQKRLPIGDNYTISSGEMVTTVTSEPPVTSVPAITSGTKCIQTVTVTEKELETVTVKETITITVDEEPTPVEPVPAQCAEKRAQCGGKNYNGPTCCPEGYICRPFTSYYSECVEKGKEY